MKVVRVCKLKHTAHFDFAWVSNLTLYLTFIPQILPEQLLCDKGENTKSNEIQSLPPSSSPTSDNVLVTRDTEYRSQELLRRGAPDSVGAGDVMGQTSSWGCF